MIISVSRRTDIPAFYVNWFLRRVEQGYFYVVNPFNAHAVKGYSLMPEDVDVIVFLSKNPAPIMPHLDMLTGKGYRYYFQFTLNDYPRVYEPRVPKISERIETFRNLSKKVGSKNVIWRYDPIILSSLTPLAFHIDKFTSLAERLSGYTERLVVSFVDFYGKVSNRFKKLSKEKNLSYFDITTPEHRQELHTLCSKITEVASRYKINVFSCGELLDLKLYGIEHGSCVDAHLINDLFGLNVESKKDKNQRPECLCAESVDLGVYNTCKFKCAYCYANYSEKTIETNLKKHKLNSASLINEYHGDVPILKKSPEISGLPKQLHMFASKIERPKK